MWIEEFRNKNNLDRYEFARLLRRLGARMRPGRPIECSETLIWILERMKHAVTHPNIANLIAAACGATAEQRDMIVAEKWRGKWTGDGVPRLPMEAPCVGRAEGLPDVPNGKDVVMIDAAGMVLKEFASMSQASTACGQSISSIYDRVWKRVRREFELNGISWRLKAEWDRKSEEERRADIAWVAEFGGKL